jgi:drug/metabolite transporter (DMT)-like permease
VTAVVLAGCLWLALRPPRWLLPDRHARRFGIGMAVALVAGFVLVSRLGLRGVDVADAGMMSYLLFAPPVVVLAGSAVAAAVGRSFRAGLWACAWATVLGVLLVIVA